MVHRNQCIVICTFQESRETQQESRQSQGVKHYWYIKREEALAAVSGVIKEVNYKCQTIFSFFSQDDPTKSGAKTKRPKSKKTK